MGRLLLAALVGAGAIGLFWASTASAAQRPNVLFIVTDDQRIDTFGVMPNTKRIFEDQGTHFPNAFATTPTCCPSRSSILTGLYAHNHGVKDNNQGSLLDHSTTLERALGQDGYRTGIFGKFLNAWPIDQNPPFFDRWAVLNNGPYHGFRVNEQGVVKTVSEYSTTYLGQKAVEFVQEAEQTDNRPWFLYLTPTAPHEPFVPEAKYSQASVPPFQSNPAYFEEDRSDKPRYVRQSLIDPSRVLSERTAQLRMLMSVDDAVSSLFSTLQAEGEATRTLAFFISDNGYVWGEHGLNNKSHAYTHSVKIPMYMRWPGQVSAGAQDDRLVANIDLAPTALDAAEVNPGRPQDGMSLLSASSRSRILLERLSRQAGGAPTWAALRTPSLQYTEYYGGGLITYQEDSTSPAGPNLTDTDPNSPANENSIHVKGGASTQTTVQLYRAPTTAGCTAQNLVASGSPATLASPGLAVSVPDDSTTRFRATATDRAGNRSPCSGSSIVYTEDSTPPPGPTLTDTDPDSPANDKSPRVKGTAQSGSTVRLYRAPSTAGCTTENLLAVGSAAEFGSPGFEAPVEDDSTTRFRATATDRAGNTSPCSASSLLYVEDSRPPAPPTVTDTTPGSPANDNTPAVKGGAAAGSIVRIYAAGSTAACIGQNLLATGSAAQFSSAGITVALPDDSTTRLRATAVDQAGNSSTCSASSIVYVEDSTAPAAPTLTGTDPSSPANANSPRVKGTAAGGSTVRLYRAAGTAGCTPANLAATGSPPELSSPGLAVSVADDSTTRFRATATDQAGNASACSSSSVLYTEDSTPPPAPHPISTDPSSPANDNAPKVKGDAQAGATVRLYKAPTVPDCTAANLAATGSAAEFASPGVAVSVADDSTTRFRGMAIDKAGNTSPCSASSILYTEDSTPPSQPTPTGADPSSPANHNLPTIKGTAASGSTVRLYRAMAISGCITANLAATGPASGFASPGLQVSVTDDSTTRFRATATDQAGNSSGCSSSWVAFTEDSTPPSEPSLTDTNPASPANNNLPRIKGTAPGGSTILLYSAPTIADCTPANLAATGTAAQLASPGLQVSVLDDSTTPFRATATDKAGNTSPCSAAIVYTEDSTLPPAAGAGVRLYDVESPTFAGSPVGGASSHQPPEPTLTGTDPASPANDNSPRIKGDAEADTTVRLYTSADCSGAAAATGSAAEFSLLGLQVSVADDSTTTFRATVTDQAGDISACSSSSIVYTEDSTPPDLPTLADTDPDSPANDNAPNVKGDAQPGATVRLYTTGDCSGAAAATGPAAEFSTAGLQVSVSDDSITTFRATATDRAGNGSGCSVSAIAYTEDSTPPQPPTLADTDPHPPANDNAPRIKGTAAAGSTVSLYTTGDCSGAAAATGSAAELSSDGLQVSLADDSITTFRATAADQAGNSSGCSPSSIAYIEDSTPPDPPDLTGTDPASPANDNSPRVTGSAAAGSNVRLYTTPDCSGPPAGSSSAGELSSPGLVVSVADDSSTTLRGTATDQAGNISGCSAGTVDYTEDSTPPDLPTLADTDPDSPANDNSPRVKGDAQTGSTVRLYTTSGCSGAAAAIGPAGEFSSPGLQPLVVNDSITTFRATATDRAGNTSPCSISSIAYIEDSTPPKPPNLTTTDPVSPANHNTPKVKGSFLSGTTIRLYASADCSGPVVQAGSSAEFSSTGLEVSVPDDSTTIFAATATDRAGNPSECSGTELLPEEQPIFREYYDFVADPWELTNYLGDADAFNNPPAQTIQALRAQLMDDLNCSGRGGVSGRPACP